MLSQVTASKELAGKQVALLPFLFKAFGIGARSAPGPSLGPLSALSPSLQQCLCSWGFPDAPSANLHTVCSSLGLSDLQTHSQWPLDRSQDARRENTHLQSGSRCLCTYPLFVPSALGEGEHCALTSWWFLHALSPSPGFHTLLSWPASFSFSLCIQDFQ